MREIILYWLSRTRQYFPGLYLYPESKDECISTCNPLWLYIDLYNGFLLPLPLSLGRRARSPAIRMEEQLHRMEETRIRYSLHLFGHQADFLAGIEADVAGMSSEELHLLRSICDEFGMETSVTLAPS